MLAALAGALVLAATGCAASATPTSPARAVRVAARTAQVNEATVRTIRSQLYGSFGGQYAPSAKAAWYDTIEDIDIKANKILVETTTASPTHARHMCVAIATLGRPLDDPIVDGLQDKKVFVLDRNGAAIAACNPIRGVTDLMFGEA
jgi:hypothetical protein